MNFCDSDVTLCAAAVPDVQDEEKDYQEQLKQMLQDLAKEKEKDVEKPLPLMNQVLAIEESIYFSLDRVLEFESF